jgi:hypothetical protein
MEIRGDGRMMMLEDHSDQLARILDSWNEDGQ